MPRIYTVSFEPLDFCVDCFPTEEEARRQFGDDGRGPDGRGSGYCYNAHHPDYDGLGYTCHRCGADLCEVDNRQES